MTNNCLKKFSFVYFFITVSFPRSIFYQKLTGIEPNMLTPHLEPLEGVEPPIDFHLADYKSAALTIRATTAFIINILTCLPISNRN